MQKIIDKRISPLRAIAWLALGILIGGAPFSRSLPRSALAIPSCDGHCYRPSDLAGLLVSVGIQQAPGLLPNVVEENAGCLAMVSPRPEARVHFLLFPKRDIRNIGSLTADDQGSVMACLALVPALVQRSGALNYRLLTNGPALQHIAYLHFHFLAN